MAVAFDFQTAEYSAVGCILIDARCLPMVREVLPTPDAFESSSCREAYAAACLLADGGKPIDPVTVGHMAGLGNDFLRQCMELAPDCNGAAEYARTVAEGFQRRQLGALGDKLLADSRSPSTNPGELLTAVSAALERLAQNPDSSDIKTPTRSLGDFLQYRADVNADKRQALKTGFPALDSILGGFAQGGFYILAARPGVGKSAFGIALADMLAREHTVLYASLEMTEEELNARRIAAFSTLQCSFGKLLFGHTTEQQDIAIINACGILNQRKLRISAASSMTVGQLEAQARRVEARVVMVDYLGLLSGTDRKASEYERITQISGDLKRLAKRLDCTVIALCQLNRESTATVEGTPRLSQLRSSGALEQDADGVMLLHRTAESGDTSTAPQRFFIDVAKNRHGRTGTAELSWYAPVNRFEDRSGRWPVQSWSGGAAFQ